MKTIGFGELSIQLIFPLFMSLSRNLRLVVFNLLTISHKLYRFPFITSIFMSISHILGGLLEFVVCFNVKKSKQQHQHQHQTLTNGQILTVFQFSKIQLTDGKPNLLTLKSSLNILLITIVSIIENDFPEFINQYIATTITNLRYQLKIINLFFIAIISIPILNYPLFRHQYFSIGVIVIGLVFLLFQSLQLYVVEWYFTVSLTFCYSLVSVQKVSEKYLMHYLYFSPYRILLYEGILGLILSFVIEIALSLTPCPQGWFCEGFPSIENPLFLFEDFDFDMVLYLFFYVLFVGNIYLWAILTNF